MVQNKILQTMSSSEDALLFFRENGQSYTRSKSTLLEVSEKFRKLFATNTIITRNDLTISPRQLDLALRFLDTLLVPETRQGWQDMILGLEFLEIPVRYQKVLVKEARNYLNYSEIPYAKNISPLEVLKNPSYLDERPQEEDNNAPYEHDD